jgi:hypothetical protein
MNATVDCEISIVQEDGFIPDEILDRHSYGTVPRQKESRLWKILPKQGPKLRVVLQYLFLRSRVVRRVIRQ